ncbi:hypothetical protein LK540_00650 [Massilia sp. IC2-278]|uniref:hypothetical protein n=1 Tax=Massilia sp. IC2-278 TaxID=2887200 RepID=UPI001E5187D4|nr:hypothetical protein [Massilia sp. IC2-278]MCC2958943.1 hypothetical protein [Massilia sp. IC2-278]
MSMQSEVEDTKGRDAHGSTGSDAGSAESVNTSGTADSGAQGKPGAGNGNQQSGQHTGQQDAMPPSQTDDDQYDQGTVQRES